MQCFRCRIMLYEQSAFHCFMERFWYCNDCWDSKNEMPISRTPIKDNRKKDYNNYLHSAHWKQVRKQALQKANNHCEQCGSDQRLQVHHKTYRNRGNEQLEDVVVLCSKCHKKKHPSLKFPEKRKIS